MANFREVNKAIKAAYPNLKIEAVRGEGYVYFDGDDGFDKIDSIYTHPVSTSTETLIKLCLQDIAYVLDEKEPQEETEVKHYDIVVKSPVRARTYVNNVNDSAIGLYIKGQNVQKLKSNKTKFLAKLMKYADRAK